MGPAGPGIMASGGPVIEERRHASDRRTWPKAALIGARGRAARRGEAATATPTRPPASIAAPRLLDRTATPAASTAHLHRSLRLRARHPARCLPFRRQDLAHAPELFFHPGRLTRRYIDGERAKFVSPMALFLFTVFLMFAVFQLVGIGAPEDLASSVDRGAK